MTCKKKRKVFKIYMKLDQHIEICYNYWDGSNTLFYCKIKIDTTIGKFLEKIKEELSLDHSELRSINDDGLIYVVFDTIIPHVNSKYLAFNFP